MYGRVIGGDAGLYDPYGMTGCGIAGARVCLADSTTCIETDPAGQFVLPDLPARTPVEITVQRSGFRSALRLARLGDSPVNLYETRLLTSASATAIFENAGIETDDARGSLAAIALTAGEAIGGIVLAAHASIALEPGDLKPVYSTGANEPSGLSSDTLDPSLSETKEGGWGIFFNLTPGDYGVHIERNGAQCTTFVPGYDLGTDAQGDLATKVRDGFTTTAAAYCP